MQTRKQKAAALLSRLAIGPAFSDLAMSGKFNPETARNQYRRWSETWVITELCQLIPELREQLGPLGYVDHERIDTIRKLPR